MYFAALIGKLPGCDEWNQVDQDRFVEEEEQLPIEDVVGDEALLPHTNESEEWDVADFLPPGIIKKNLYFLLCIELNN